MPQSLYIVLPRSPPGGAKNTEQYLHPDNDGSPFLVIFVCAKKIAKNRRQSLPHCAEI